MSCNDPELRYLRNTPAGVDYVSQITAQESDRLTRSAFRDLVLTLAPRGGKLFDFGAGPGIDARFFAEKGFTVDAYDVDPRMREFFRTHCRDLMDSRRVTLGSGGYREFLTRSATEPGRTADLVISNFAPLNLVDDLRELFEGFQALTSPGGKVLANVLNPCFLGDMRSHRWWRAAPRLWRDGELFLPGPQAPYYRRLLHNFRAASAPHFRLSRVFRGMPPSRQEHANGIDIERNGHFAWLHIARCRYMFLLFEKTDRQ
jgi:SAM-dependent methyltransferase